jgi:Histidine kinase
MNWYSFIFSEKKSHRLRRHVVFWLLWWAYFTVSYFHYAQTGLKNIGFEPWNSPFLLKSISLLVIHIIACYYFISYLMPRYLFRGEYTALVLHTIILSLLILFSSYFLHKELFPIINAAFNYNSVIDTQNLWWTSITSGILSAPKIICAAAAAKLLKRWWMKQKEKERLEKEKLITDLQLLKAQIHPEFLFSSLDNISLFAQKKEIDRAATLLLKLADILSYMLYESEHKLVLLEKELNVIKDYLVLQKTRMGDRLEIDIAVKGEPGTKTIAPLLLFSLIENSFSFIGNKKLENTWLNLEFSIDHDEFTFKLIHGKTMETEGPGNIMNNTRKRLDFFYPGKYELKTTVEPEIMMTFLKIVLEESKHENQNTIYVSEQVVYATA